MYRATICSKFPYTTELQKGDENMNEHIVDYIGKAALLEQTAEEASELSQACLKMARKIRGENPTPKDTNDILENLNEEIADVNLCCNELVDARIASYDDIGGMAMKKYKRWCERVKNEENNRIKQKECLGTSCGNCGGSIDVHDKYCRHCGKKIVER
jgi:NTP pyrophosphatase (non-canonical NTP hydrolase)